MTCYTAEQIVGRAIRLHATLKEVAPDHDEADLAMIAGKMATWDMDKFEAAWARRRADFPDWMSITEGRIVSQILDTALADPEITILVNDGEEDTVAQTRDRHAIEKETCQTAETYYVFYRNGERIGFVWLIHGNEFHVISDYTDKPEMDDLLRPANKLAEELEG